MKDFSDKEVKKRVKPTLTERWWKDAWPHETARSQSFEKVTKALKAYKEARRGKSRGGLAHAVKALRTEITEVIKEANSTFRPFKKRKQVIVDELNELKTQLNSEYDAIKQAPRKMREVFAYNLAEKVNDELEKNSHTKDVRMRGTAVTVELMSVIVEELEAKNLANSLFAEYSNALENAVLKIKTQIAKLYAEHSELDAQKKKQAAAAIFDRHAQILDEQIHKAPTNIIKKLGLNAEMEAQYQKELNKRRREIAKTTVLTGAAVGAIALPGTTAFAVYGAARSAASLAQQLLEHNQSISSAATSLEGNLKYLAKVFEKSAGRAASETGGTTLNALVGVDVVPTLEKATTDYKRLTLNAQHAGFKVQKLTDHLTKLMDFAKSLEKEAKKDDATQQKRIALYEKTINTEIKKIVKLAKNLNDVERRLPDLKDCLLKLGKNSKAQIAVNEVAQTLVGLAGIAFGGVADAGIAVGNAASCVTEAEKIAALAIATTGFVDEIVDVAARSN